MRHLFKFIPYLAGMVCVLAACTREALHTEVSSEEIVVRTSIFNGESTKAVSAVADYVGRGAAVDGSKDKAFEAGDKMTFTTIKRTTHPLAWFTYNDVNFMNLAGTWERMTEESESKIYWSDAENDHTFIGYSLPSLPDGETFDWVRNDDVYDVESYFGSIGVPTEASESVKKLNVDFSTNDLIKREDLLLTYNTHQKADPGGSVATIVFHHALANVRVVVNIRGYTPSVETNDKFAVVSDLHLDNMPLWYKWRQDGFDAMPLGEGDGGICAPGKVMKGDFKAWIPNPAGVGVDADRTFTFYSLAVPGMTDLEIPFVVTYPDPLKAETSLVKTYTATVKDVLLKAGCCTTINISLNHANEAMTVGASYMDWEFVESPDEGNLRKNSLFLEKTSRDFVTIVGDEHATEDDAVWLYATGTGDIRDIYGNDGSEAAKAYQIHSAQQLLAFAYEVNNGRTFENKFVRLDASLTLQPSRNGSSLDWIGIGTVDHPFNGTFLGNERIVTRLKGRALFGNLGTSAKVEGLTLKSVLGPGNGDSNSDQAAALAQVNSGHVHACMIESDVVSTSAEAAGVGAFIGINNGLLYACCHIGKTEGKGPVGGLVGTNNGQIVACYDAGSIIGNSGNIYGIAAVNTGAITGCFFNDRLSSASAVAPEGGSIDLASCGKTTAEMQKEQFAADLNGVIADWQDKPDVHTFIYAPANYPVVK